MAMAMPRERQSWAAKRQDCLAFFDISLRWCVENTTAPYIGRSHIGRSVLTPLSNLSHVQFISSVEC
ncbi:unnamed protein product [Periconia digitata]|uniref:Uncharacterized protein n=1 Tax=Periconia digitata TaxID=1303443 RepID=A0A9W4UNK9_9PLEO|nr:unnamed protein product [Periconia digitata]